MSRPGSPKVKEIDTSLEAWIYNTRTVLNFPITILTVAGLLVAGSFAETASRKSLEFIDNVFGRALFFIIPMLITQMLDWPTGLLAAAVSLILFARIQKPDVSEGFSNINLTNNTFQTTKIVSDSHRWFVEKVLGEMPVAISSDKVQIKRTEDNDARTSSSSSMYSSSITSDGTK